MPFCQDRAENQMGQNYDGLLEKFLTSEDKMKFCLFVFACLGP